MKTTPRYFRTPTIRHTRVLAHLVLALGLVAVGALTLITQQGWPPAARAGTAPAYRTIFGDQGPGVSVGTRTAKGPVVVGTRFVAARKGLVHGARFWKVPGSRGRHVAGLWGPEGTRLARARYTEESATGWQHVMFAKPVRIRAGGTYTVGYEARRGRYAATPRYAAAPASGVLALAAGHTGAREVETTTSTQYWSDVLYVPGWRRRHHPHPTPTGTPSPTTEPTTEPTSAPTTAPTAGPTSAPSPTGTATAAPTATTSPAPTSSCKATPSACGYPDATNTGPAAGTRFTQVPAQATSGPGWSWNPAYRTVFVKGAGAVLDGLDIAGSVVIDAPDVELRNSRIAACGGDDDGDVVAIRYRPRDGLTGSGARIVDNDINGTPEGCTHRSRSGVRDVYGAAPAVLVQGNNVYGSGNGVTVEHEGLVVDNWVHDLGHLPLDHHSGISTHGGAASVTFRHNTVLLHGQRFAGGGGISGALTIYSDFGHAQNVTLEDNFVSGGSYVVYGGNTGNAASGPATGIRVVGNRFACGDWLYGPVMAFSRSAAGNEWSNNYCDATGSPVTP